MTRFGVLQTSTGRIPAEAAAGLDAAMVELNWGFWQNTHVSGVGQRNTGTYVANMVGTVRSALQAGMQVTLGLGLHFPPAWVAQFYGNTVLFKNEFDHFSTNTADTTLNMVWVQTTRTLVQAYVADVKSALGESLTVGGVTKTLWQWVTSIRWADGTTGEAFYPQDQGTDADPKYNYWAFDAAAQNGTGLASGMVVAPNVGMPTGAQVAPWVDWYLDARARTALWFINYVCDTLAFPGEIDVVGPGSGVRPSALTTLRARTSLPSGHLLASGAVWATLYTALAAGPWASRTVVHCSSVADNSGSDAPPQNGDLALTINDPLADGFGSARWHRFVAAKTGLGLSMENPGSGPDYATTMMDDVFVIVKAAPETKRLLYARESAFFDGTLSLATYSASIADANATQQTRIRVSRLKVVAADRYRVRVSRLKATTANPGTNNTRVRVSRLKLTTATSNTPQIRIRVSRIRARTMVYSPGCYLWDGPGTEPYMARVDVWDGTTLTKVAGPDAQNLNPDN